MALDTLSRREKIIEILCMTGSVRIECLSQQFGVSCVTIRNDLRYLEKRLCIALIWRRHAQSTIRLR